MYNIEKKEINSSLPVPIIVSCLFSCFIRIAIFFLRFFLPVKEGFNSRRISAQQLVITVLALSVFLAAVCPTALKAQTCNGSLGDPVLNEAFSTSSPLPAYKTNYTYVGDCPDASGGTYTISNFIFGCGPHSWVKLIGDHTGNNLNSNYMLVNAASTPGAVYRDTVNDLCGSTVYQFGIWVTSVMTKYACAGTAVLPNLKFEIKTLKGVTLMLDSTGYLPIVDDREWKFYGHSLLTPADVNAAIVSITIDPKYGCGSAFAIDDITLAPCGASISATIDGTPGPADVCADYSNAFVMNAAYSPGFADPALQWQKSIDTGKSWIDIPGETTLTYKVPHRTSGVILYRICIAEKSNINSIKCRIVSNAISTSIHPLAEHAPPGNMLGCLGKDFFFPEADPHALQVLWSGPNGYKSVDYKSVLPNIQYKDTGLYKLKETFYFNCVSLDTFYLNIFPGTTVSVNAGYAICQGMTENLSSSANGIVTYKWTPSTGLSSDTSANPVAKPGDSTKYEVLVTNNFGCKDSAYVQVNVYRNPVANAGPDKFVLKGDTAHLDAIVKGTAVNISWSPGMYMDDIHAVMPHVDPPAETEYQLTVLSTVGCGTVSDDVIVKVFNDIFVPNAFTPNGDGKNDIFHIPPLDNYKLVRFSVYNRWGQIVFETKGTYRGWDGMVNGIQQPPGAYIYYFELVLPNGKRVKKTGTVLLIR